MSHARRANQSSGWLETTVRFGGDAVLKQMYAKAYEGHVRQYMVAKTTDV